LLTKEELPGMFTLSFRFVTKEKALHHLGFWRQLIEFESRIYDGVNTVTMEPDGRGGMSAVSGHWYSIGECRAWM
jgi:hypothetical protein